MTTYDKIVPLPDPKYVIMGVPTPLARARHGKGNVWDSQKKLKIAFGIMLSRQHDRKPLFTGPLELEVMFYFPLPRSMSQNKITKLIDTPHSVKPDLDNCIKFVCDLADGILYNNDSTIATIIARKLYSVIPKTEFILRELSAK